MRCSIDCCPSLHCRVAAVSLSWSTVLGATPAEELYIIYRRVAQVLGDLGVVIVRPLVGRYATSMEMAGASILLMKLDAELEALLAAPASCPFWSVS